MAAAALKRWESIASALEKVAAASSPHDIQQVLAEADTQLEAGKGQPIMPRAVWKKLLQAKVPLRVLRASSQLMKTNNSDSTALAIAAAEAILMRAAAADSTSSLTQELRQQLEESHWLADIPAMIAFVQAPSAPPAEQQQSQVTQGQRQQQQPPSSPVKMWGILLDVHRILAWLVQLWPAFLATAHGGRVDLGALLKATLQWLGHTQGVPAQHADGTIVDRPEELRRDLLKFATNTSGSFFQLLPDPAVKQAAFQHASFLPCLCYYAVCAVLGPQLSSGSESGGGSSSAGSGGSKDAAAAAANKQLLKLVGCSTPELALEAAQQFRQPLYSADQVQHVNTVALALSQLEAFRRAVRRQPGGVAPMSPAQQQQAQAEQQMCAALAGVLLQWAVGASSSSSNYTQICCVAATGAYACTYLHIALKEGQRPQGAGTSAHMSPDMLATLLTLVLTLLPALLTSMRTQLAAAVAPGSSSSSSRGSGSSGSATSSVIDSLAEAAGVVGATLSALLTEPVYAGSTPPTCFAGSADKLFAVLEDLVRTGLLVYQREAATGSSSISSELWHDLFPRFHSNLELEKGSEGERRFLVAVGTSLQEAVGTATAAAAAAAGDSDIPQSALSLFGLLLSMLKVNSTIPNTLERCDMASDHVPLGMVWCRVVCGAATTILTSVTRPRAVDTSAAAAPPTANMQLGLPWVVLLGRCCLQLSAFLKTPPPHHQQQVVTDFRGVVGTLVSAAGLWLLEIDTIKQLKALGYGDHWKRLQQQLRDLGTANTAAVAAAAAATGGRARNAAAAAAAVSSYSAQLHAVGLGLTAFATPLACNNPSCGNVASPAEAELVGGRSCVCGGCLVARYCSRSCQSQHWKHQHKPVCKALAAAAAATEPAAAGASTSATAGAAAGSTTAGAASEAPTSAAAAGAEAAAAGTAPATAHTDAEAATEAAAAAGKAASGAASAAEAAAQPPGDHQALQDTTAAGPSVPPPAAAAAVAGLGVQLVALGGQLSELGAHLQQQPGPEISEAVQQLEDRMETLRQLHGQLQQLAAPACAPLAAAAAGGGEASAVPTSGWVASPSWTLRPEDVAKVARFLKMAEEEVDSLPEDTKRMVLSILYEGASADRQ